MTDYRKELGFGSFVEACEVAKKLETRLGKAEAVLKRIAALDVEPQLHAADPRKCAICMALEVVNSQPDWVVRHTT